MLKQSGSNIGYLVYINFLKTEEAMLPTYAIKILYVQFLSWAQNLLSPLKSKKFAL